MVVASFGLAIATHEIGVASYNNKHHAWRTRFHPHYSTVQVRGLFQRRVSRPNVGWRQNACECECQSDTSTHNPCPPCNYCSPIQAAHESLHRNQHLDGVPPTLDSAAIIHRPPRPNQVIKSTYFSTARSLPPGAASRSVTEVLA